MEHRNSASAQQSDIVMVDTLKADRDTIKLLATEIPKYDGTGGAVKFRNFVEKIESYFDIAGLSPLMELAVAKSKLIGDAHIFWLSHINCFANDRPERITTWDMW